MKLDRETLIEDLAQSATDNIDLSSLLRYYYDEQHAWLTDLDDDELVEYAKDFLHSFEEKDYKWEED